MYLVNLWIENPAAPQAARTKIELMSNGSLVVDHPTYHGYIDRLNQGGSGSLDYFMTGFIGPLVTVVQSSELHLELKIESGEYVVLDFDQINERWVGFVTRSRELFKRREPQGKFRAVAVIVKVPNKDQLFAPF